MSSLLNAGQCARAQGSITCFLLAPCMLGVIGRPNTAQSKGNVGAPDHSGALRLPPWHFDFVKYSDDDRAEAMHVRKRPSSIHLNTFRTACRTACRREKARCDICEARACRSIHVTRLIVFQCHASGHSVREFLQPLWPKHAKATRTRSHALNKFGQAQVCEAPLKPRGVSMCLTCLLGVLEVVAMQEDMQLRTPIAGIAV